MSLIARLRTYGSLVALSHTVFALPFAASAVVLARAVPHTPLTPGRMLAMIVCMVAARSSAMAYNRYADRDVDAKNPRTRARHIPAGLVSPREVLVLAGVSGVVFVASATTLGTLPAILSPFVLAVLLGYSLSKRFTWASHAWLGLALALAPGGAWIAAGAAPNLPIVLFMGAVLT
jgi:4-hydroxybenzoate polyprenyltransferase